MFWFWAVRHVESLAPLPGTDPHLLHWKVKSEPLNRQGSHIQIKYAHTNLDNFIIQIPKAIHYYTSFTF